MNLSTLKKCKYCFEEINKKAIICSNCNKYQNYVSEIFRRYTTNSISIVLLIFTGIQLYLASLEKSRAFEAANKAEEALNRTVGIENGLYKKDSVLRILTKANYEYLYITSSSALGIEHINDSLSEIRITQNDKLIKDIIEPDLLKQKLWIDSLKTLIK